MQLASPVMGDLEVNPDRVVELPGGLIGLPRLRRFAVVELEEESPFKWLQSMDDHEVGFIISEPTLFSSEYRVEIRAEWLAQLGVESLEDTVMFVIVTLGHSLGEVTANLRAPVIVSLETRRGFQAALTDPRYSLHAPLPGSWSGITAPEAPGGTQAEEGQLCSY